MSEYQLSNSDAEAVEMAKLMLNEKDFALFWRYFKDWQYVLWQEDITEEQDLSILEFSPEVKHRHSCEITRTGVYTEFGEVLKLSTTASQSEPWFTREHCQLAFPISHFDTAEYKYLLLDTNP